MAVERIHLSGKGDEESDFKPEVPLKILCALRPESASPGVYTVELQLSREVTVFEQTYFADQKRQNEVLKGDRLVLNNTTIEEVQRDPGRWSKLISAVGEHGETLREAAEGRVSRARAELQRRADIADSIEF